MGRRSWLPPEKGLTLFWSDVNQLVGATLLVIGAVLPVINPLGDAPLFLEMTEGLDEATRASLATRRSRPRRWRVWWR